jgi:hypothetical protein
MLSGQDKSYLMSEKRGKFINETRIAERTKVTTAIKIIAQGAGETLFLFDDVSTIVPYELTFQHSDSRWKAVQDLADLAQCYVYYDVNGYLRLQKIETNFDLEPLTWTYRYGDSSERFYAGNTRRFDEYELNNHTHIIGGSSQSATFVYDLVVDEDATQDLTKTFNVQNDFSSGTFTNISTINIDTSDVTDVSLTISQYGTDKKIIEKTESDFTSGTLSNVISVRASEILDANGQYDSNLEIQRADAFLQDWNTQPYTTQNTLVNSVANSILNITSVSNNAAINMTGLGSFDPTVCEYIAMRYRITSSNATEMKLYYLNTTYTSKSESAVVTIPNIIADGQWHTVLVDMSVESAGWKIGGNITGWILTWATTEGVTMDMDYIRLHKNQAINGNRISPAYDLSTVGTCGKTSISWTASVLTGSTLTIETRASTDGGNTWGAWQTVSTSGGSIPSLTLGQNLANTKLQVRQTLNSTDGSIMPSLEDLTITVQSQYKSTTGTYVSPTFGIGTSSKAITSGFVKWNSTLPTNTNLTVQVKTSTDNGGVWSNWQTVQNGSQFIGTVTDLSKLKVQYQINFTSPDNSISALLNDITFGVYVPNFWKGNPYSIQKIGRILYEHNSGNPDPLLTSVEQCKWRAKYELMKRLGYAERVSFQLSPNFLHDVGDIIQIEDSENSVTGRYKIMNFDLPLIPDLMSVECTKFKNFITDWDFI